MSAEDREREERRLGDLTEQKLRERGELIVGQPVYAPPSAEQGKPVEPVKAEVGREVPPQDRQVLSVFDIRPVGARDFYKTDRLNLSLTVADTPVSVEFTYTVPKGSIGILRGFKYTMNPEFTEDGFLCWATLAVNGIGVPDYTGISEAKPGLFLGQAPSLVPCYVIANENDIIKLTVTAQHSVVPVSSFVFGELYGNILLKTGIPSYLEPASPELIIRGK